MPVDAGGNIFVGDAVYDLLLGGLHDDAPDAGTEADTISYLMDVAVGKLGVLRFKLGGTALQIIVKWAYDAEFDSPDDVGVGVDVGASFD